MSLSIFQVDAFASTLFAGNPAAVIPLETWLSEAMLQAVAMENNLSETAYFVPRGEDFELRWFTPLLEVDLCGHATLATAHVLFQHLGYKRERIAFHTRSGRLEVVRTGAGYQMDFPADESHAVETPQQLQQALFFPVLETRRGRNDFMAVLGSSEEVEQLRPDMGALAAMGGRGVIVTAAGKDGVDFVSRCFFPNAGVPEDPVTGSAHTTMAPYWANRLGKYKLEARQLSARGGALTCTIEGARVLLDGQAVTYMKGEISV